MNRLYLFGVTLTFAIGAWAEDDGGFMADPDNYVSASTVSTAFEKLGYEVERFESRAGNPHLVVDHGLSDIQEMAVFFADCNQDACQDLTFYANFGTADAVDADDLNEWNHIGSYMRATAFRSTDDDGNEAGPIGLSMTVSFLSDEDLDKLMMHTGLFLYEVQVFGRLHR